MLRHSIRAARTTLDRFLGDERGGTAIEYALIASGVSVAIVGVVVGLGTNVQNMFNSVATALK